MIVQDLHGALSPADQLGPSPVVSPLAPIEFPTTSMIVPESWRSSRGCRHIGTRRVDDRIGTRDIHRVAVGTGTQVERGMMRNLDRLRRGCGSIHLL